MKDDSVVEPTPEPMLDEDTFVSALKKALNDSELGRVMTDEEFETWWKESDEYSKSPEGRAQSELEDAVLTYYADNVAKYKFTDAMGEISGFGEGYEKACRVMLDSGLQWLDKNPDAEPKFKGNSAVYGVIIEDNDDAKALSEAVTDNVDGCTGAMHHAVVSSCLWIRKNGWDAYVERMSN